MDSLDNLNELDDTCGSLACLLGTTHILIPFGEQELVGIWIVCILRARGE